MPVEGSTGANESGGTLLLLQGCHASDWLRSLFLNIVRLPTIDKSSAATVLIPRYIQ